MVEEIRKSNVCKAITIYAIYHAIRSYYNLVPRGPNLLSSLRLCNDMSSSLARITNGCLHVTTIIE